jgi:predicted helicase
MIDVIKPSQKPVKDYYATLADLKAKGVTNELGLRTAMQSLMESVAKKRGWALVAEYAIDTPNGKKIPDGALLDSFDYRRGLWEAKDPHDDLDVEVINKKKAGYPQKNILFDNTVRGLLIQDDQRVMDVSLENPKDLCALINAWIGYTEPVMETFEQAVDEFSERVPELANGLVEKIKKAHDDNTAFQKAFQRFYGLCQTSLNANISREAVDEMLVQHLLTNRLISSMFSDLFMQKNVIAQEVQTVIEALTSKYFDLHDFYQNLERFYTAIEAAGHQITDFSEKQHFLDRIYERFFQGYSVETADTHGIVYTPQPIVDFMCNSVEHLLEKDFGLKLWDEGVVILDPCTGTGNFVVNLLRRVPKDRIKDFYRNQIFANEVMLMPYYIAALNIEHAYHEITGEYEPFEGICFVDTLDLAEPRQISLFTQKNADRVEAEKKAAVTVIIGNPPYNAGQVNENDQNRNRKYPTVDTRIKQTYANDSTATLKTKLYDMYVRFFRWATDRLEERDGIVCYVSNNSFVDAQSFDGVRKWLPDEFNLIQHLDIGGNVRVSSVRGQDSNVFDIRVGVGVTLAARTPSGRNGLQYCRVGPSRGKESKFTWLRQHPNVSDVDWTTLIPDDRHSWLVPDNADEFRSLLALVPLDVPTHQAEPASIFKTHSLGTSTNRDMTVYDFRDNPLLNRIKDAVEAYNYEVWRYAHDTTGVAIDDFVDYTKLSWSATLKGHAAAGVVAAFSETVIRNALYRPFVSKRLYFDPVLIDRRCGFPRIFPTHESETENRVIVAAGYDRKDFSACIAGHIPNLNFYGDPAQCFPFYVYALLHHPGYRERYADNLKRELPRIPFAPDFRAFVVAGEALSDLHLNYEDKPEYALESEWDKDIPGIDYRVEKMKLSKDKRSVVVNRSLTLHGVPETAFEYRLGNRSALDWVIDQYRVKTDKRSGITHDPNRADDADYIVRLVKKVIGVSVETVGIVNGLPVAFRPEE